MHLDAFLARRAGGRDAFCRALGALLPDYAQDCICLSGSLVEGIGNLRSDVDVYVLATPNAQALLTFGSARIVPVEGVVADIEFVAPERIERLCLQLGAYPADGDRDARTAAAALAPGDLKLLHNLLIAEPIGADGALRSVQGRIDRRALARLLFDTSTVWMHVIHEDIVGLIEAGDEPSARALLRSYRMHLAGALLAALGETNPAEKWRTAKLRSAVGQHGALPLPGGLTVGDAVHAWTEADRDIGHAGALDSLRQLTALANAILPWGLQRFLGAGDAPVPAAPTADPAVDPAVDSSADPATHSPDAARPAYRNRLPALAHDCVVRCDAQGISVGRMGSARRLYLNALGHETLLQFDGRRQLGGALGHLRRISGAAPAQLEASVSDFHRMLLNEQLI